MFCESGFHRVRVSMPTNRAAGVLIFDDCQLAIEADLKTKVARTTADKRNKADVALHQPA